YVKTQLQLDEKVGRPRSGTTRAASDCVKVTVSGAGLLRLVPRPECFGAFEEFRSDTRTRQGNLSTVEVSVRPSAAGICEAIFAVTRHGDGEESANQSSAAFFQVSRELWREQGLRGCYRALTATMMKQGSNGRPSGSLVGVAEGLVQGRARSAKLLTGILARGRGGFPCFEATRDRCGEKTRMRAWKAHKYRQHAHCFGPRSGGRGAAC
uniref:Mitochondrial uncoupling protein 2 n=1 Tax=Macrostomum lignano TaxID=282301 RepID=A0A1I8FFC1_9PLAT